MIKAPSLGVLVLGSVPVAGAWSDSRQSESSARTPRSLVFCRSLVKGNYKWGEFRVYRASIRLLSGIETFYKAPITVNYPPENVLEFRV